MLLVNCGCLLFIKIILNEEVVIYSHILIAMTSSITDHLTYALYIRMNNNLV